MNTPLPAVIGLCALTLSGCANFNLFGGATGDDATVPGIDTSDLTRTVESEFVLANQTANGADALAEAPTTGTAAYTGAIGARTQGDIEGFLSGTLDVALVNFENGAVVGELQDLALYGADGTLDRAFTGALNVDGDVAADATVDVAATGTIVDVSTGASEESTVALDLDGTLRDDRREADTIAGSVTGGGSGDFDFTLIDGRFYLFED
ncbi:MAG: hypothetical protein ACRBCL_16805 [Maritimibacter sp.]